MSSRRYGWRPDLPDHRDHLYSAPLHAIRKLPSALDLSPHCPPVLDQGQIGSCTSQSIGALDLFVQMKQDATKAAMPSRLFIYYNERLMEGTVDDDAGAMIRDGMKVLAKQGAPPESMWPYEIDKFRDRPPEQCFEEGLKRQAIRYARVDRSLTQLKGCIAEGYPFVFGFTVYEAFESEQVAETGVVPMPAHDEEALGGHAVMACGYSDAKSAFLIQNSWGVSWGLKGRFWLPYAYISSRGLASDFWTLRSVEMV